MSANVGRPVAFDRDVALRAAMELFWRQGYESTSMQDLLATMNLSKSSLYHAFGGKQLLFEECLRRYGDTMIGQLRHDLDLASSGLVFIRAFLETVLQEARGLREPRGCLVLNTANEFAQRDPSIARGVAHGLERFRKVLVSAVRRGQDEGDIRTDQDARTLAHFLMSNMSGLRTLAKGGADEKALRGIIDVVLDALA
jgi:TetR/AcrR family transcriptional regulator, transcriptional repressor for nem operon